MSSLLARPRFSFLPSMHHASAIHLGSSIVVS
jgi:hypothetical protein